jgi:2-amino-4-hydroxy-6-hydroxymethyldihydropteridine diphosphokinase
VTTLAHEDGRGFDVVIGLGSNLGDRIEHLRSAVRRLERRVAVRGRSNVYETAPVGPPQPDYLNAAVRIATTLTFEELLSELMAIERDHGRERDPAVRWVARTLDLDILWADGVVLTTPGLTVPHAHLTERAFALVPLLEVAPEAIDPRTGLGFASLDGGGLRRTTLTL